MRTLLIGASLLLALAIPPPIAISVSPAVAFEPATVNITLRIPRNPSNRSLEVILDGTTGYYSSSILTHGPTAPTQLILRRHSLPAGDYVALAILALADGSHRQVASQLIQILERGQ